MNNSNSTFKEFNLSKDTFNSITEKGFETPSEIQEKVIPLVLERSHDVLAVAQTGTGKTAAFGLPLVDLVQEGNKNPKAIILAPTRELALQVTKEIESYSTKKQLNILTVYGGASIANQLKDLRRGVDIIVGTPGRIVDMIERRALKLNEIENFILDEADEMLNMGFLEDMEFILSQTNPKKRVYLFSATMPKRIQDLSKRYMKKQIVVKVETNQQLHTELIDQSFYKVKRSEKTQALINIINTTEFFYGIVFCKTKSDVDSLTKELKRERYDADCIHGDIAQNKREKILQKFRDQKINLLIATDVAARGIDVNNLTHVVNHSLPQAIETYTHRIGRTGRAGNKGSAVTFVTPAEMGRLSNLEKQTGFKLRKEELPSKEEIAKQSQDREFDEYKRIILGKRHESHLVAAEELMKEYDSKEIIAALLYKDDFKRNNLRDREERPEGRRENKRSYGRDRDKRNDSKRDKREKRFSKKDDRKDNRKQNKKYSKRREIKFKD